eukprot:10203218-Ditylum_brightwellii.AAC.1
MYKEETEDYEDDMGEIGDYFDEDYEDVMCEMGDYFDEDYEDYKGEFVFMGDPYGNYDYDDHNYEDMN